MGTRTKAGGRLRVDGWLGKEAQSPEPRTQRLEGSCQPLCMAVCASIWHDVFGTAGTSDGTKIDARGCGCGCGYADARKMGTRDNSNQQGGLADST